MQIATWNVNSIKARQDRLLAFLKRHQPDVVCLQELKVAEEQYPREAIAELGYVSAINAQKTYNGVAILSRLPLTNVVTGMADGVDDPQARIIAATAGDTRIVCVYAPNGGEVASDKWTYKLAWYERFRNWLDRHESSGTPLAVCGDFNVAPEEIDVHEPRMWERTVLFHPEARSAFQRLCAFGLQDAFRQQHPGEANLYSWWDYRLLGFPKNRGLRIDHILTTESLTKRCTGAMIDREERKGQLPSDHAPVICTFA